MENKPASDKILNYLTSNVLEKCTKSLDVTCVTFPGSGEVSQLRYLIRHFSELPISNKKHIFTFLDVGEYIESESQALRESISFIKTHFSEQLSIEIQELMGSLLSNEISSFGGFINLINQIMYGSAHSLTFVIENFRKVYDGNIRASTAISLIESIKRQHPMGISFVYLAEAEFDPATSAHPNKTYESFFQNIVFGKNILFDKESFQCLFNNQKEWHELTVSNKFIAKVAELSFGDPTIAKSIALKALANERFEEEFLRCNLTGDYFNLIGKDFLVSRYERIVSLLKPESYTYLKSNCNKPTNFLLNTGLVNDQGEVLNPLFKYYLDNLAGNTPVIEGSESSNIYSTLSGQELTLLKYLSSKEKLVVTKDEIAQLIWGESWEENYSDWAIDKLVSNLRKKLKGNGYQRTIKTFKGKGLMLV